MPRRKENRTQNRSTINKRKCQQSSTAQCPCTAQADTRNLVGVLQLRVFDQEIPGVELKRRKLQMYMIIQIHLIFRPKNHSSEAVLGHIICLTDMSSLSFQSTQYTLFVYTETGIKMGTNMCCVCGPLEYDKALSHVHRKIKKKSGRIKRRRRSRNKGRGKSHVSWRTQLDSRSWRC